MTRPARRSASNNAWQKGESGAAEPAAAERQPLNPCLAASGGARARRVTQTTVRSLHALARAARAPPTITPRTHHRTLHHHPHPHKPHTQQRTTGVRRVRRVRAVDKSGIVRASPRRSKLKEIALLQRKRTRLTFESNTAAPSESRNGEGRAACSRADAMLLKGSTVP